MRTRSWPRRPVSPWGGVLAATLAEGLRVRVRSLNPVGELAAFHDCDQVRLFRNRPAYRYEQSIHEQIAPSILRAGGVIEASALGITHYGYVTSEAQNGVNRDERNLGLLERAVKTSPGDLYLRAKLGCTYFRRNRHQEAERILTQVVADSGFFGAEAEPLQESLRILAAIAIARGDYARAWEWAEASLSFGIAGDGRLDALLTFAHASLGVGKHGLETAMHAAGASVQGASQAHPTGRWADGAGLDALRQAHYLLLEVRGDPQLRPEMVPDVDAWLSGCRSLIQAAERLRESVSDEPRRSSARPGPFGRSSSPTTWRLPWNAIPAALMPIS